MNNINNKEPAGPILDLQVAMALGRQTHEVGCWRPPPRHSSPPRPRYSTDATTRREMLMGLRSRGCAVEGPVRQGSAYVWLITLPLDKDEKVPVQVQGFGKTGQLALARAVVNVVEILEQRGTLA